MIRESCLRSDGPRYKEGRPVEEEYLLTDFVLQRWCWFGLKMMPSE